VFSGKAIVFPITSEFTTSVYGGGAILLLGDGIYEGKNHLPRIAEHKNRCLRYC